MSFPLPTTTTPAAAAGGFSFGLPAAATTTTTAAAAAKPPTFSFGSTGGGDAGGFGAAPRTTAAATIAPIAATTLTASAPAAVPALNFGTPVAAVTAQKVTPTPTLSLGTTTATVVATPGAPAPALAAAAPTSQNVAPIATTTSTGFASLSTATKTTDSSAVPPSTHITYNQLEEQINKWTLELEEQEKVFTDQATQINAWDSILIANNEKILQLNDAVHKVKTDQHSLEQELEFIATQHNELEESLGPLQKDFIKLPQVDVERSQTYLMVENLDTQLKQMSEDLKEIIDNLNEANKGQDNADPIMQIGKILNAHMSSLQWIESSSTTITKRLDDVTKMHDNFKRDSERSFRSAYYN